MDAHCLCVSVSGFVLLGWVGGGGWGVWLWGWGGGGWGNLTAGDHWDALLCMKYTAFLTVCNALLMLCFQ